MRRLLVKIKTSFGSCFCDYADKNSGDTQSTSGSFENDSVKDDVTKQPEG